MNYHDELVRIIEENELKGAKPKLLLHCCCAPCASYCLEFLTGKFDITCFFYNPNITSKEEYDKRLNELKKYVSCGIKAGYEVIDGGFAPEEFYSFAVEMSGEREGGARCFKCYELRLEKTARVAEALGFDYFATTLTVSPHKRADKLNEIGFAVQGGAGYLPSDFKKKGGYARSIQLSKEHGLYRQNYCGCEFSKKEAEERTDNGNEV